MPDTVNPEFNRANQGSLMGLITQALAVFERNFDSCLPATVVSYDRANHVATVTPTIKKVGTDGTLIDRGTFKVPVWSYGGGGLAITFPLVAGSKGWIKANDRDISLYSASNQPGAPNTKRMHSFEDGTFYPDIGAPVTGADAGAVCIQTTDGHYKISIFSDKVLMTSPIGTIEMNNAHIQLMTAGATALFDASGITFTTTNFTINTLPGGSGTHLSQSAGFVKVT